MGFLFLEGFVLITIVTVGAVFARLFDYDVLKALAITIALLVGIIAREIALAMMTLTLAMIVAAISDRLVVVFALEISTGSGLGDVEAYR